MKAILVARVSTAEQEEAGNSLPAQLERTQMYCKRKQMEVVDTYSFDESAYKTKRDEFDKIMQRIAGSKEKLAVCFDKVDRLSRNLFDKRVAELYEMAVRDEIELHFVSDNQIIDNNMNAGDKFSFGMKLGLSKYYSDAISDNTRRAFEQKRRRGEWTGKVRLGYLNVQQRDESGNVISKDIVPDPERAHLIRKLFELYASGQHSITTIWETMSAAGLKSHDGKKLSRSNIEAILKDPFYYGVAVSQKYGSYPHRYPTIVTRELFKRCEDIREGRNRTRTKALSKPFIFKGLLKCAQCGCLLSPEIKKGKFIYYSCTNAKGVCKRTYIPEAMLMKPLHELFKKFEGMSHKVQERLVAELRNSHESEAVFHSREISRIRAEYDRVQRRIEGLLDLRLDMSITQDQYEKKLHEMKEQQERLNIELEEHTNADHQFHIHVGTVLLLSQNMGVLFNSSEVHEKRAILSIVLQNSLVSGKNLEFTLRKPFDTVLEFATCPSGLRTWDDVRLAIIKQHH